jgi:hypothetical protein
MRTGGRMRPVLRAAPSPSIVHQPQLSVASRGSSSYDATTSRLNIQPGGEATFCEGVRWLPETTVENNKRFCSRASRNGERAGAHTRAPVQGSSWGTSLKVALENSNCPIGSWTRRTHIQGGATREESRGRGAENDARVIANRATTRGHTRSWGWARTTARCCSGRS